MHHTALISLMFQVSQMLARGGGVQKKNNNKNYQKNLLKIKRETAYKNKKHLFEKFD